MKYSKEEIQEIVKIHIVGGITLADIARAYNTYPNAFHKRIREMGIASNRHCMKPSSGYKYCCGCDKILREVKFYKSDRNKPGNHCISCNKSHNKDWKGYRNRLVILKKKYGITEETYRELVDQSKGVCPICKEGIDILNPKGHAVDHDHETGKVRAFLCGRCNMAIGGLRDSPELLREAANYIEEHRT